MSFLVIRDGEMHWNSVVGDRPGQIKEYDSPIVTSYGFLFLAGRHNSTMIHFLLERGLKETPITTGMDTWQAVLISPADNTLFDLRVAVDDDGDTNTSIRPWMISEEGKNFRFSRAVASNAEEMLYFFTHMGYPWKDVVKAISQMNYLFGFSRMKDLRTGVLKDYLGPEVIQKYNFKKLSDSPLVVKG